MALKGVALAEHLGLAHATAEQLRLYQQRRFGRWTRLLKIAPTPISGTTSCCASMRKPFFAAKQHPIPVLIGSNGQRIGGFGVVCRSIQKCAVSGVLAGVNPRHNITGERRRSARAAGLSGYGIYRWVICRRTKRSGGSANRAGVTGLIMSEAEHNTYANGACHGNEIP